MKSLLNLYIPELIMLIIITSRVHSSSYLNNAVAFTKALSRYDLILSSQI